MLKKNRFRILLPVIFAVAIIAAVYFRKPYISAPYPQEHSLVSSNNFICTELMRSAVGARDDCETREIWSMAKRTDKDEQVESMRIGNTDNWISEKKIGGRQISYRFENALIYIKNKMLIKELEDKEPEREFKIITSDDRYVLASSFGNTDPNLPTSTYSATLSLDKTTGVLIYTNTYTSLYCQQSLASYTTLYSCKP